MIFYHSQLMNTSKEARLFMVDNNKPFDNYDDHEAGIYFHLHDLIEQAIEEHENPIALMEGYLGGSYHSGDTPDEMVSYLFNTAQMNSALQSLKESWQTVDASLPDTSLRYGGIPMEEALDIYSETTLRSYLETLSLINHAG